MHRASGYGTSGYGAWLNQMGAEGLIGPLQPDDRFLDGRLRQELNKTVHGAS